ncbi:E3 ubiquitin/ISG15 ligase TRIM25-like [Rana temporaria]|uniref:E3 ubiquitin/ISG15 ligase TRIM25-like n=1 Tax=Rana temporaria TaxID=8407 RepID=UPI001AADABB6|nr:E3 ubiquitin/ISG15 ligase TRIM25-like [Rana temporaria]
MQSSERIYNTVLNRAPNRRQKPWHSDILRNNPDSQDHPYELPYMVSSEPSSPAVTCTYCVYSATPAVKSCLLCEASLCPVHLQVHSTSPEHVLTVPLNNLRQLRDLKCSIHKEVMKYYCFDDSSCICVSCCLAGKHKGHQVEQLEEASEKKKTELRNLVERLTSKQSRLDKRVLRLKQQREEVQDRTSVITERVAALFINLRRQLEDLEKRLLCEISAEEDRITHPFTLIINQLEIQKEDLSRSITEIEELINLSDPLAILTKTKRHESLEPKDQENLIYDLEDIDEGLISVTLHRSFNEIMETVKTVQGSSDLQLDVETAANDVYLSGDKKTVSWSKINQRRHKIHTRFKSLQILSQGSFLSGRHYWEVQSSQLGDWMMGVCYSSTEHKGTESVFGNNRKSWCLSWKDKKLSAVHDHKVKHFLNLLPCQNIGIYLD